MTLQGSKILVVEDEERIRKLLRLYLEKEQYEVMEASDGEQGLALAQEHDFALIILDVMLPVMDGMAVCTKIRETKLTPILMLTAKGEEKNRVQGFEAGADDYVVKPFSPRELMHRVRAILRRTVAQPSTFAPVQQHANTIVLPYFTIDDDAHKVTVNQVEVNLTPKEYELLHYLAQTPDKVYSREQLLKDVWHYEFYGDLRTVDTHVKRLREKLNQVNPHAAARIVTVWGVGYKLEGTP